MFYEHRGFRPHLFLPFYYNIKGKRKDGFTYVLYVNGGHPPRSPLDHCLACCCAAAAAAASCLWRLALATPLAAARLACRKVGRLGWLPANVGPRVRQIAQSSAAVFS